MLHFYSILVQRVAIMIPHSTNYNLSFLLSNFLSKHFDKIKFILPAFQSWKKWEREEMSRETKTNKEIEEQSKKENAKINIWNGEIREWERYIMRKWGEGDRDLERKIMRERD